MEACFLARVMSLFVFLACPLASFSLIVTNPLENQVSTASACKVWRQDGTEGFKMTCSATLIQNPDSSASDTVITAAHCTSFQNLVVSCEGDQHAKKIRVSKVIRHPDFYFGSKQNDMALLQLDDHFSFSGATLPSKDQIQFLLAQARSYHQFKVRVVDSGANGSFGHGRFLKTYDLIRKDHPFIQCAVVGFGKNQHGKYGHLQTQALTLETTLDLNFDHRLLSFNQNAHGFVLNSGDSGGPLLCQTQEGSFLFGVHSHSMEETNYSFLTPTGVSFLCLHGGKGTTHLHEVGFEHPTELFMSSQESN